MHRNGVGGLIIDHDMTLATEVADRITVLNFGRHIGVDVATEVLRQPDVSPPPSEASPMSLLSRDGLTVRYGEIEALRGLSLVVDRGEVVTLLGGNGAGKSTTLRAISGLLKPVAGDAQSRRPLDHRPRARSDRQARHCPCAGRPAHLPGAVGAREHHARRQQPWPHRQGRLFKESDGMFDLFPDIRPFADALGWTLSGGPQQMVAEARGLMAKPRLLLLDEPSCGLARVIVQKVFSIIAEIRRRGTRVLLVEQNARMALSVADRGYVGRLAASGKPAELRSNDAVQTAYLGGGVAKSA